jgi:hypothetical protein
MINHARTLLLNARDTADPAPWERYMGVFSPLALPSYLENIRKVLVGSGGWWDRTYRVEMLLTMLDSRRYAGKFDWMDSRVTPAQTQPFLYSEPKVTVTRVASPTPDTFVSYIDLPGAFTVPVKRTWQVVGSASELFSVLYLGSWYTIRAYNDTVAGGWRLHLADDFDLLFSAVGSVGDVWNVRSYVKPQNVFADLPPAVMSLPSTWTQQLFSAVNPNDEPLKEYKRWYSDNVHAEDKVAAVTLAYLLRATQLLIPVA